MYFSPDAIANCTDLVVQDLNVIEELMAEMDINFDNHKAAAAAGDIVTRIRVALGRLQVIKTMAVSKRPEGAKRVVKREAEVAGVEDDDIETVDEDEEAEGRSRGHTPRATGFWA